MLLSISWYAGPRVLSRNACLHISMRAEWYGTYLSCADATSRIFLKYSSPGNQIEFKILKQINSLNKLHYYIVEDLQEINTMYPWRISHLWFILYVLSILQTFLFTEFVDVCFLVVRVVFASKLKQAGRFLPLLNQP